MTPPEMVRTWRCQPVVLTPRWAQAAARRAHGARQRSRDVAARSIFIDRRAHLDTLWTSQTVRPAPDRPAAPRPAGDSSSCAQASDLLRLEPEATHCAVDCIAEVQDMDHLERRLGAAGSSVVCLALYSRVRPVGCSHSPTAASGLRSAKPRGSAPAPACVVHAVQVTRLCKAAVLPLAGPAALSGSAACGRGCPVPQSCGACKDMLRFQQQLCRDSSGQLAGAVFLKHNIRCGLEHRTAAAAEAAAPTAPKHVLPGGTGVPHWRRPLRHACPVQGRF